MISILTTPETFPLMKQSVADGFIVLFTDHTTGTVVYTGFGRRPLGCHETSWVDCHSDNWKDVTSNVILKP